MGMKIDRFTLGIILGVLLLVVGAVITIAFTGGRGWQSADYLNEDTPEAVVHDAFLATVRNEPDVAMSHYSRDVVEDEDNVAFPRAIYLLRFRPPRAAAAHPECGHNRRRRQGICLCGDRQLPPGRPV